MDSFCGKDCAACASRKQLGCAGCREGMGKRFSGPCEIAACCREKGHERCETCGYKNGCSRWIGREGVPRLERLRREAERAREERLAEQAPVLGKWLWLLFWLAAPREIAGLLEMDSVASVLPDLGVAGTAVSFLCLAATGVFLWQLGPVLKDYRTAALLHFAVAAVSLPGTFLSEESPLAFLLAVLVIGLGLCRDYVMYHAHAQVLDGVDSALAEKWRLLWKLNVGVLLGLVGSVFLVGIFGLLGLLVLLALAVGLLALWVLKLVYLWRTAKVFREYEGNTD